ncbi:pectinesterase family protein [Belliella sp. DSM 111904]|uniref:Pectinesterase n=1 Tax=Belliella filtrata TaxID=2923435 RepID=A0ABS9UW63_9BACT|nr:pectinesterase family protein [Belliella filtrata]MCH7408406.1 pectinesterase family protein [Belliella filtrata]
MNKLIYTITLLLNWQTILADPYDIVVSQDGSADFGTVQEAIMAVPDFRDLPTVIYIKSGIYREKIILPTSKTKVVLIGEDPMKTILTYDDYASKQNRFGEEMGTTGSSSFFVFGDDFMAKNITFENSAGPVGQAVAMRVTADRVFFENCRFLGFQDTLYAHGERSRQYYKSCYIEGTTDFIFGWSTAVFEECEIYSKAGGQYITAASTLENVAYGFVFVNCSLTGDAPAGKVYLGRPWRIHAKTVFIHTEMGEHIRPEGWHNWNKPEAEETAFYAEYNSSGAGADKNSRVSWSKQLLEEHLENFSIDKILAGADGWIPGKQLENKLWPSKHHSLYTPPGSKPWLQTSLSFL